MSAKQSWTIGVSKILLLVGFLVGMGYSLFLFSVNSLTTKESTLLGIVLTICSTLASWLLTHIYAAQQTESAIEDIQERSQANLRTYALKASEKVNNLSNELNRLALYLEQELSYNDHENPKEALSAREERIESAIHLIRTLKSVNDTSLSDWEGVIGEELEERREEQIEKEQQLQSLMDRYELLAANQSRQLMGTQVNAESLRAEVQTLKADLRTALAHFGGSSLPVKSLRKKTKSDVETVCPDCKAQVKFRQRASEGGSKMLTCKACAKELVSVYTEEKGFQVEVRGEKNEPFKCVKCSIENIIQLNTELLSAKITICKGCGCILRVTRQAKGLIVKVRGESPEKNDGNRLSDELITHISSKLPPQPWPTGVHKTIAAELGLPQSIINQAIQCQIDRGVFKPQADGIIIEGQTDKPGQNQAGRN